MWYSLQYSRSNIDSPVMFIVDFTTPNLCITRKIKNSSRSVRSAIPIFVQVVTKITITVKTTNFIYASLKCKIIVINENQKLFVMANLKEMQSLRANGNCSKNISVQVRRKPVRQGEEIIAEHQIQVITCLYPEITFPVWLKFSSCRTWKSIIITV